MGYGKENRFVGNSSLYPLDWTEEEAVATHQKEKKDLEDVLQKMVSIIQMGTPSFQEEHSNFLSPVIHAILHSQTIEVVYHTQSRDFTTKRLLDPYYLCPRDHRFYLIAYCHEKKGFRTFRLSRFLEVKQTEETFTKQEFKLKEYFQHTWSIIQRNGQVSF